MEVDTLNLYAEFVSSDIWYNYLKRIRKVSNRLADTIGKYGIGTKVNLNGYDYESGQLLDDIPKEYKNEIYNSKVYDLLCQLANAYAEYCLECQQN